VDENQRPDVFQRRLRGPHIEGLPQDDDRACAVFVGTALFSFEGTNPIASA